MVKFVVDVVDYALVNAGALSSGMHYICDDCLGQLFCMSIDLQ